MDEHHVRIAATATLGQSEAAGEEPVTIEGGSPLAGRSRTCEKALTVLVRAFSTE
jgi:hypothetical protein